MTRLLILGSSHVAAMKQAAPQFAERHPDVELSFFAAPAPAFRLGRVGRKGFFSPKYRSKADRQTVETVNGAVNVDVTAFDRVLISGFRFSLGDLAQMLLEFDILEGNDTGKTQMCSLDFLYAIVDQLVGREMKLVTACLGDDRSFTLTDAPYPAETIGQRSDDYAPARALDHFISHPDAAHLFDYWKERVAGAISDAGYDFLPQPDDTVAGPFATKGHFTGAAPHFHGEEMGWTDHRHMNADFGLCMLDAFATKHLNPVPATA